MAVTIEDIALELGRATPAVDSIEAQQWAVWIGRAKSLIARRAERLGVTGLDPDVVDTVVTLAVAAHVRQPDDVTIVDRSVDDARVSKHYKSSTGRVSIIDEWWADLGLTGSTGAFSTRPGFEPDRADPFWWEPTP